MKNKFLSILALGLLFTLSSSTIFIENNDKEVGRQCCAKTFAMADGAALTITACAGWIFSNDRKAYTRACRKVDKALKGLK